jgi:hypothetical protein
MDATRIISRILIGNFLKIDQTKDQGYQRIILRKNLKSKKFVQNFDEKNL